jgi:hypothetical protein
MRKFWPEKIEPRSTGPGVKETLGTYDEDDRGSGEVAPPGAVGDCPDVVLGIGDIKGQPDASTGNAPLGPVGADWS